ncbi:response regulator RpfG family c-di-GMP phosphodiesterase [Clostridium tetanomorphum]|uniref:Stage 0 sporulation protein A homolog n=2 Tax=Clostridium tetanomorphum TaxID=1553 RepID=A0A923EB78_CLOTT|nr:response regulator [Clostridium tetanomorphum]MBC2397158.1 response regulator [Clostridium tetanomorphum]MBP1863080.1 response regulator RpfG family c-di-GMP phosphodiesterase [Clostridium tetanomorphum]NRS82909.1 response regulator RpfG family c-di-GMP phosphodiesterase [Clostridium tetanomorphum]
MNNKVENISILFVDDEQKILSSIQRGIIGEKFKGFFANSGKQALEIMEENEISVIVTDMRMPEMDGLQLLKIVKEKYPDTIRMVLSGYAQLTQVIATINKVGVFKFILKPWNLEDDFIPNIREAMEYYILKKESEKLKGMLEKKNELYHNLVMSSDRTVMEMKKGFNSFININKYALDNVKRFLNSNNDMSKEILIKYLNMIEDFYDKYSSIVFESSTSFMLEKLLSDFTINMKDKYENVNIQIYNKSEKVLKGRYKLANLILNILGDIVVNIYESNLSIVVMVNESFVFNKEVQVELFMTLLSKEKKDYRELLILTMFLNELLKEFKGECYVKEMDEGVTIVIKQKFIEVN